MIGAKEDAMDEETKEKPVRAGSIALLAVGGAIALYLFREIVVDVFTIPGHKFRARAEF